MWVRKRIVYMLLSDKHDKIRSCVGFVVVTMKFRQSVLTNSSRLNSNKKKTEKQVEAFAQVFCCVCYLQSSQPLKRIKLSFDIVFFQSLELFTVIFAFLINR